MLLRAAPWRPVLGIAGGGVLLGLLGLAAGGGAGMRVLQLSWVLLAAGSAWAMDEPAAAAVDACPLVRWRRLAARAALAAVPALAGLAVLGLHERRSWRLALMVVGVCAFAFAAAVVLRHRVDEPGEQVALVLLAVFVPLVAYEPAGRRLPLFEPTSAGALLWAVVLSLSAAAVARP